MGKEKNLKITCVLRRKKDKEDVGQRLNGKIISLPDRIAKQIEEKKQIDIIAIPLK